MPALQHDPLGLTRDFPLLPKLELVEKDVPSMTPLPVFHVIEAFDSLTLKITFRFRSTLLLVLFVVVEVFPS
jgi:hypothetical protein